MRDYARLKALLLADLGFPYQPDGHYLSDDGHNLAGRKSLANSFYKKLAPKGARKDADDAALKKFKSINQQLPQGPFSVLACNEAESCFYDYYRDNLLIALQPYESMRSFDLDYIRESMMCGPGSAQKADSSYMVSKLFESTLSYTDSRLIQTYRDALAHSGMWADAEMHRHSIYGFTKVRGGKVFFAPKNSEISRVCSTESNLGILIQKAGGEFIEERLKRFYGINLSTQSVFNQELARIGSLDGSFGTIDLVSASDCIGLYGFRRDFPRGVLKTHMEISRSSTAVLPDGSDVELNMVSTMGNGFTFPLQTLMFACAVRAVYQVMGFPCTDPRTQFGVYGDDIVVRREAYDFTVSMLQLIGFTVNVGKSFNTGPFRESCGHDYYNGVQIRGVYVKSLETPQEVCSAFNRLTRWSAEHGVLLTATLSLLKSWTRDMRIPLSEADDAGLKYPFKLTIPRVTDNNYWFNYRCYRRRVRKLEVIEPDSSDPVPINPMGIGVGFLAGHIRRRDFVLTNLDDSMWKHVESLSVSLRDRPGARARYQVSNRSLPFWDFRQHYYEDGTKDGSEYQSIILTDDSYSRWEAVMTALPE